MPAGAESSRELHMLRGNGTLHYSPDPRAGIKGIPSWNKGNLLLREEEGCRKGKGGKGEEREGKA